MKHTKYEDVDIINVDEYEDIIDILINRLLNTEKTVGIVVNKEFAEYITSILLKIPETSIKEIDFIDWYNINEYLVYINNDGYVTAIPIDDKVVLDNADIIYINMDGDIKQDVIDYCVNEDKEVILFGLTDDCNCDGDCENCIGHDYDVYKLDDDYMHGFTASKTDDSSYVSYSYYTTEDLSDKDIEKILKAFSI